MLRTLALLLLTSLIIHCQSPSAETEVAESNTSVLKSGLWLAHLNLGEELLPFYLFIEEDGKEWLVEVVNADERIEVENFEINDLGFSFQMPIFDSEFQGNIINDEEIQGEWINHYKSADYRLPFRATFGEQSRFEAAEVTSSNVLAAKYSVLFDPNGEDPDKAIGTFEVNGQKVKGTFITETGDYRHLEGNRSGDELLLSTFDGSHAFLFKAKIYGDSLKGKFWSGNHYLVDWVGVVDEEARLTHPDSLTFIKEGYDGIVFDLPDLDSQFVAMNDPRFDDKVTIVQILGSWCPNCMDETAYYAQLHQEFEKDGLNIVGLSFERTKNFEKAVRNVKRLKERLNANYTFLIAGTSREDRPTDVLPMLNHMMSYPTSIFIDRQGNVRKIHTGFYGPGTGSYYEDYAKSTRAFVQQLLNEGA